MKVIQNFSKYKKVNNNNNSLKSKKKILTNDIKYLKNENNTEINFNKIDI